MCRDIGKVCILCEQCMKDGNNVDFDCHGITETWNSDLCPVYKDVVEK